MTKPTQAQIEAVAIALYKQADGTLEEWKDMGGVGRLAYVLDAQAALTAAAEVGVGSYSVAEVDRIVKQTIAATKERCAQVVDALIKKANRGEIAKLEEAAAEIRKLQG